MIKLLLLLLIISGTANGQIDSTGMIKFNSDSTALLFWVGANTLRGQDTSRVIMLCSDTSKVKWSKRVADARSFRLSDGSTLNVAGVRNGYAPMCFWLEGYVVTHANHETRYLTYKKRPLTKNVFVWMAHSIDKRKPF